MVKIGTSFRIKSEILNWIDKKVNESVFANRTHAVEFALRQLMKRELHQKRH